MVALDCNVLILYVIGLYQPEYIDKFKRTRGYHISGFNKLLQLLDRKQIVVTTHVLAEASNLLEGLEHNNEKTGLSCLKRFIYEVEERNAKSLELTNLSSYIQFGLSDASLEDLCLQGIEVITADFKLYGYLINKRYRAININHFLTN